MLLRWKELAGAQCGWDCGEGTRRGVEKGVARPDSVVLIGRGEELALILNKMTAIREFGVKEG